MTTATPVIRGWHVAVGFVIFFGAVIATDVSFISLAYKSFPGEVSKTPYEDGLAYNQALAAKAKQQALGWSATAESSGTAESRTVTVSITNAKGAPVTGLAVKAALSRPATSKGELALALKETAPGFYSATAKAADGDWVLAFQASNPKGDQFKGERRFKWL